MIVDDHACRIHALGSTYSYIWDFGVYYYSGTERATDFSHLLFVLFAWLVVVGIRSNAKRLSHAWAIFAVRLPARQT
jgi:hypothetical protein